MYVIPSDLLNCEKDDVMYGGSSLGGGFISQFFVLIGPQYRGRLLLVQTNLMKNIHMLLVEYYYVLTESSVRG